jgi:hypothetical protein
LRSDVVGVVAPMLCCIHPMIVPQGPIPMGKP